MTTPDPSSSTRPPLSGRLVRFFGHGGGVAFYLIGAMLLVTINRALPTVGIPDFWQQALVGVLILSAIALDRVLSLRRARLLIEARDES